MWCRNWQSENNPNFKDKELNSTVADRDALQGCGIYFDDFDNFVERKENLNNFLKILYFKYSNWKGTWGAWTRATMTCKHDFIDCVQWLKICDQMSNVWKESVVNMRSDWFQNRIDIDHCSIQPSINWKCKTRISF